MLGNPGGHRGLAQLRRWYSSPNAGPIGDSVGTSSIIGVTLAVHGRSSLRRMKPRVGRDGWLGTFVADTLQLQSGKANSYRHSQSKHKDV